MFTKRQALLGANSQVSEETRDVKKTVTSSINSVSSNRFFYISILLIIENCITMTGNVSHIEAVGRRAVNSHIQSMRRIIIVGLSHQ